MTKQGRPKGAVSFANVTLSQLNELFVKNQSIPVSRVWLKKLNIEVESVPTKVITPQTNYGNTQEENHEEGV